MTTGPITPSTDYEDSINEDSRNFFQKHWSKILVAAIAAIAVLFVIADKARARVDVVNGVPPMSRSLASIEGTLAELERLPAAERGAYLERTWPHLGEGVTYYLRQQGKLTQTDKVKRVTFFYGDLNDIWAESSGGKRRFGYFSNQIVAVVDVEGQKRPIAVTVQCLNGTFATVDQITKLQAVGSHTPIEQFWIGEGRGLTSYVDYPLAIDLAQIHHLPVYRGRVQTAKHRITYAQAREMQSQTDEIQVTVGVKTNDYFNLVTGAYVPARMVGG